MTDGGTMHPGGDLRVAIVGYGLAGATFHAPLIAATPGMRVAFVVTSNPARAEEARRAHAGVRVLPSADELWEEADDVDLVVIATPNRTHAPLARAAIRLAIPTVVDKPFAVTADEGRALAEEAWRRGVPLSVFHNRRWDGDFLTLRRLLAEGALGQVHRFESRFERWRPTPKPGWRESGDPADAGGGVYDLGSHLIDQALVLFGPARRVYAELDRRRPGVAVDDDAFVAIEHASGVRSQLWMSALAADHALRMRVLGARAAYVKRGMDVQEAALRSGARPPSAEWGAEPPSAYGRIGADEAWSAVETAPGDYPAFYAGMAAAVRGAAPVPVHPADAVAVLEVIEAARRSAAERAVIDLPAS